MTGELRSDVTLGHEALDSEISEWRAWWNELSEFGQPRIDEMGCRLERFREHLANHFASEETGLFVALAAKGSRSTADDIARLRDEHRVLLSGLDELIGRYHSCAPEICCWGDARREFEVFLDQLQDHEQREEALQRRLPGARV